MIDEQQLAEWEAMANAATPGPWDVHHDGQTGFEDDVHCVRGPDGELILLEPFDVKGYSSCVIVTEMGIAANLKLAAASRTAVPALIAAYREVVAQFPAWHDNPTGPGDVRIRRIAEALAEGCNGCSYASPDAQELARRYEAMKAKDASLSLDECGLLAFQSFIFDVLFEPIPADKETAT